MRTEFYIGWMPTAPATFVKHMRKVLLVLFALVTITGISLGLFQKKFSSGNFEFGKLTSVKGIYFNQPVPLIKLINGRDIFGNLSYVTVPSWVLEKWVLKALWLVLKRKNIFH